LRDHRGRVSADCHSKRPEISSGESWRRNVRIKSDQLMYAILVL
jgi:hypothetical protein